MNLINKDIVELRREFHRSPEVGWLEFQTTIKIINFLKSLGYELDYGKRIHGENRMGLPSQELMDKHLEGLNLVADYDISEIIQGYTGAVAKLDTGKPGPRIALRFDIDALNIAESKDPQHLPVKKAFVSQREDSMHACGHDGHIALGLDLARWLMEHKGTLKGSFILIFQPAEEGVRGAKSMVEAGVVDHVDYLLGGHIGHGKLGVGTGGFLATTKLDIYFEGVPSHAGAAPEEGKNALLAAASCTLNLHSLPQFGSGMSRLNVGVLQAGTSRNIVANKAKLQVETRGDSEEINKLLSEKLTQVVRGAALSFDVDYRIDVVGGAPAYSPLDLDFINEIADMLEQKGFELERAGRLGGSEDFSYMMREVEDQGGKALHFNFGTEIVAPHHHYRFDFDEDVLISAKKVMLESIRYLMNL